MIFTINMLIFSTFILDAMNFVSFSKIIISIVGKIAYKESFLNLSIDFTFLKCFFYRRSLQSR